MEFLHIKLTKDLSLLLHAIHSPFFYSYLVLEILTKKPSNKKTHVYSCTVFCRTEE
jgi:hypothetical protein